MNKSNNISPQEVRAATTIAVAKGNDNVQFRETFAQWADFELPPMPPDDRYDVYSEGKRIYYLRGLDIPDRVAEGDVEVGLTGLDAVMESIYYDQLRTQALGATVCRFSVLTKPEDVDSFRRFMSVERRFLVPMLWLPTSRPVGLERISAARDYPFRACGKKISGAVEAYTAMTGARAVADIVQSGRRSKANGLDEALTLYDVNGQVIMRRTNSQELTP
jgi:ATP phosphoribosyltransferase